MKIPQNFQIAIQFLEPCTKVVEYDPELVKEKLHTALSILPISIVILGWDIPKHFVEICREETRKCGIKLYRWQPLLTSDGELPVRQDSRVIGMNGNPIPGFNNMPSFTFMCPNHIPYRKELLDHLADILRSGIYDGIFLDRMRYPAPTRDLNNSLSCFCPSCQKAAREVDLDLNRVRLKIGKLISTTKGRCELLRSLLTPGSVDHSSDEENPIAKFLTFRAGCITGIVREAAHLARSFGVGVGLDCFSPTLTWSVGQNIHAIDQSCDWFKPMSYLHTFAPAGLPYELNEMITFLGGSTMQEKLNNLTLISQIIGFPLPKVRSVLMEKGLDALALTREIAKGKRSTSTPLLVGIELVDLTGITWIDQDQLKKDVQAILRSTADGIVISWDLWHIKTEHLITIKDTILSVES